MTNNHGTSEPPAPRSDSSDPISSVQTADTTVIDPSATIIRQNNQLVVQGQAPATDPTEPQASAVNEPEQERAGLTASAIPAAVTDLDLSQPGSVQADTGRSAPSGQVASDGLGLPDRESVRTGTSGSSQVTANPSLARNLTGSRIPTPGSQPARPPADVFTQPSASRVNPNYHESVGQNPMVWARDSDNHQRLQFSQPQLNQLPTRSQPVGPAPPVSAQGRHVLGYFNPEWQNRADILTREASGRPRPRYSPYPLPPAPTILTQQAPESSRHRGAAPSSISNSQQTYTNFSLVQVQPEVAGREGLSVFTQSRAVSPQAARCPLTRTDQRGEELEEELYHHTWSARDQAPDTLTDHALNSCEVFKRDLDKINAQLQLVESRFHRANSCATDINRMIEETKMTPFTDRIANARIRDIGKIRLPTYEGNSDPRTYIISFRLAMARAPLSEEEEEAGYCRLFSESLTGAALEWFGRLKENSINSFSELVYAFVRQYSMFIENNVSLSDLWKLAQGPNESLRSYITKFTEIKVRIANLNDTVALAALRNGLRYGSEFRRELTIRTPETLDDALYRAARWATFEEEEMTRLPKTYSKSTAPPKY